MNNFLKEKLSLLKKNSINNPEMELRILLNKSSIKKKDIIFSNFNKKDINIKAFENALKRRMEFEPISKIFNQKNFWKYSFYVDNFVLDPRPETELIIESVIDYFPNKKEKLKILDICTGSGCLAISLAKEYPNSFVTGTDISDDALKVAIFNSKKLKIDHKISFKLCNYISEFDEYDIIVCNPPYISSLEYQNISQEIKLYEPKIALYGGIDGLECYREISKILPIISHKKSKIFVEIGLNQSKKVIEIFKQYKIHHLKLIKDIRKLDRLLVFKKNC